MKISDEFVIRINKLIQSKWYSEICFQNSPPSFRANNIFLHILLCLSTISTGFITNLFWTLTLLLLLVPKIVQKFCFLWNSNGNGSYHYNQSKNQGGRGIRYNIIAAPSNQLLGGYLISNCCLDLRNSIIRFINVKLFAGNLVWERFMYWN